MKCYQVEKILIEDIQGELEEKTKFEFEAHFSQCLKCLSFKEHNHGLRSGVKKLDTLSPSVKLEEETKALCHDELLERRRVVLFADQKNTSTETPLIVLIAFVLLIGLTLIWAFPVLKDYMEEQVVTKYSIYLLIIVIQNILALICAPILFHIFKLKKI